MPISKDQIAELLKNPTGNNKHLRKAYMHEQRCKMHSSSEIGYIGNHRGGAVMHYLEWVRSLIPEKKYLTFEKILRSPIDTIPLTEECYSQLRKVFHGRDRNIRFDFTSPDAFEQWSEFSEDQKHFWETVGFETMQNAINSIMVVDLPAEQITDIPNPSIYFHSVNSVFDFELKAGSNVQFDWIILKHTNDRLLVYDDKSYRVFQHTGSKPESLIEISEAPHDLGYCPARFFWQEPISYREPAVKQSPLTNWLSKLDYFLFWATSKKHVDLYAPYPITEVYKADCRFKDSEGNKCVKGVMYDRKGGSAILGPGGFTKKCPNCEANDLSGPGTLLRVDPPLEDEKDLRQNVRITQPPVEGLNYVKEKESMLKKEIFNGITGNSITLLNDQAINEQQVRGLFEDRKQVLLNLKVNFESAHEWAESTQARLMFGERFISASVNYGFEFYLFSADELLDIYTKSREQKLDHTLLDDLWTQYIDTRYKDNKNALMRQKILSNLDPLRHVTDEQATDMFEKQLISSEIFVLKRNFSSLLKRFERENVDISEFGMQLEFDKRVERILEGLLSYITPNQSQGGDISNLFNLYGIAVRAGAITPQREDEDHFRRTLGVPGVSQQGEKA